ncbi:S8 family serine peptidase [Desmonostoc muscorum LEGE 12446]|uniref:S8 family serine peptidase n=1 Tax=Desmonostoc muscorum LEGE 12446 TaxID=1828758 RepID=A0A8J6ZZA3_DESMC|nr:S8 family peptidase [Desmonostoc muscorum]MCF2147189.1 S8 family serine peptidase [Desmonostoc muscorum LEGE 12446]
MPINDTSSQLLSHSGLNSTSISSVDTFRAQDDYTLNLNSSSYYPEATATSTGNYNSTNGYGLVNAGSAVSKAAGQNPFADVPNQGGNNWGADLVNAPEAWKNGYTGKGVVVAVVDTGVDYNHEDLRNNIWTNTKEIADNGIDDDGNGYVDDNYGWNFSGNNNNTLDRNGHGTHVSGTIAGENNNYGVTGIAYDAKIMPVKVLNDSGSGSYNSIAKGIRYAVDNGANVINLSLGGTSSNRTLESAINYASSKGVVVVMAAGNDGDSSPNYPARYASKSGIAVGAVDRNNNMADFSNRSGTSQISYVTAPGVNVYSSVPGNQYDTYSGTSMAAPHVAGVVALMLSANPNLTDAEVRQIITETAGNSTQSTSFNLNISNVNSLANQVIKETAEYLTPKIISSFNKFDIGSVSNQPITEATKYLMPQTIANFNSSDFRFVSNQATTETTKYLTSSEGNERLVNPEFWSQSLDYDPIFSGINMNSNENNLDFGKLVEQMQKQLEQLDQVRKFLGLG